MIEQFKTWNQELTLDNLIGKISEHLLKKYSDREYVVIGKKAINKIIHPNSSQVKQQVHNMMFELGFMEIFDERSVGPTYKIKIDAIKKYVQEKEDSKPF